MLSTELENCLNGAFHQASVARHQHLTVEHLLLAILDTPKVIETLHACGADLTRLKQELQEHIDQSAPRPEQGEAREVQPTLAFQRVLQRAVFHVQSSGKTEVGVGNVLVAIFSEKHSHAVSVLTRQYVTRLKVVNYSSHGLSEIGSEKSEDEYESGPLEPGRNERGWDREHSEKLRATMSVLDIEALIQRSESDPTSLSVDEVGVLFLVARDRIRLIEARLKNDSGTGGTEDD